jgi:hypothetical protein
MTLTKASDEFISGVENLVNEAGVWVRSHHPVDAVLCTFISRVFEVYRSVRLLAENDRGHDAQILARSALELFMELRYITNCDTWDRTYRFAEFEAKQLTKAQRDFQTHYPSYKPPDPHNLAKVQSTAARIPSFNYWEYRDVVKNGKSERIAINLREMVRERESLDSTLGDIQWAYDIAYAIASSFVHPRPLGLRAHFPKPQKVFQIATRTPQGKLGELAIVLTVFSLALIAKRIFLFWGLNNAAAQCDVLYQNTYKTSLEEISRQGGIFLPSI